MNVQMIIIDPQNDFTDPNGSLYVQGANEDMKRLSKMLNRLSTKIDDIHVTLDSHRTVQIFNPIFWQDAKGKNPNPFTLITTDDVEKGKWVTTNPAFAKRAYEYVKALQNNKRYVLCIWPYHCLIGSWGHAINPDVSDALIKWERDNFAIVDYVTKGSNIFTEHYSAVKADVEDTSDPGTMLNTTLIDILKEADIIPISGEALSHCVASSITDIADTFGDDNIKKFVLLEDTCSNVGGFENLGKDFVTKMVKRGMKVETSTNFLK